ncbi:MAG TPA: hypothetical protein VE961_02270 [Pyrinomonadaceae bacterium]|nr:hypothetical protein [Pyrinomonadaceae bacterium]
MLQKFANQRPFFFVFDAREEFGPESVDRFGFVEGQPGVNLAALEVTRLTARLQDWFDLGIKIRLFDWRYESFNRSLTPFRAPEMAGL